MMMMMMMMVVVVVVVAAVVAVAGGWFCHFHNISWVKSAAGGNLTPLWDMSFIQNTLLIYHRGENRQIFSRAKALQCK